MNNWLVYLLECSDGTLYCGATNDLEKRLKAHNTGSGAKYTKCRRPCVLVAKSRLMTKSEALKLEYKVKRLKKEEKKFAVV